MTNDEVLAVLKKVLSELEKRHAELVKRRKRPGGPLAERADRQMQILSRISSVNLRITHLSLRESERRLAKELGEAVRPLSATRKRALEAGLKKVSKSISASATFKAAIKLATDISEAADKANDAAAKA